MQVDDTPAEVAEVLDERSAPAHVQSMSEEIEGHLDMINSGMVLGWLADSSAPDAPRRVEVLANDELVEVALADGFRGDLKRAGLGDGNHAFRVNLPPQLFDGRTYEISARDLLTGRALPGSPMPFRGLPTEQGELALDGASLAGWARIAQAAMPSKSELEVQVLEDGEVLAKQQVEVVGSSTTINYRIPLPQRVFDGRPHLFSLRTLEGNMTLGELALIMPYQFTPEASVQQYARKGLTPALATAAGYRYASLTQALKRLAADPDAHTGAHLAQLNHVHEALVQGASAEDTEFAPLAFPVVDAPTVSIVIPVHNKFHVTYHCLASLLLAVNEASFEVVLVDDGSSDLTLGLTDLVQGLHYTRNEEAQGFVLACNRGATLARGEYVVMLNNDTEVTSGWLDELLGAFVHFDGVGMAGAKLLYPDGRLQEAGGIVWSSGDPWNYGRRANPHDPRYNYARQTDYLSGACVMLPLKLWQAIGGFSETFVPAYFEDTDLAFQVRDRGYKTVYIPFSEVVHFEGVSNGTSVASGTKRYQEINRPKFKRRWVDAFRGNGKIGVDVELNKDRNVESRALVLDAETPMPDQNAGSYAAIQEMRMLQALGFKCTFMPHNMSWMAHYTRALQRMGIECIYSPFATSIGSFLERRGREFDVVYITRYYVAQHYIELIRKYAPQARIVMNNADLHFLREMRAAVASGNREDLERAAVTRGTELATMAAVDLVLAYTEVERAVIQSHNFDASKVMKCPWVAEVPANVPGFSSRADIAFFGGYNHKPNVEAVEWFVAEVMPLLRVALPGAVFRVYGSKVPDKLKQLAEGHPDVVIEGWVPTVDAVYDCSRVFVAPLRSGAGIKGKVIGALAHGTPCVLSPLAAEGIPVSEGTDARIADKPAHWVDAIVGLYNDQHRWERMSEQARDFCRRHYGFEQGVLQMQEALQHVDIYTSTSNRSLVAR